MDKIAVISDIHGNLPALQAVLDDIQAREIKRIFCLGDLVGKGPDSSTSVDMVREHCETVIKGNWDDFITEPNDSKAIQWHQQQLTSAHKQYLKSLPFSVEFMMSGRLIRMFHASPRSLYDRIQPWHPIEKRISLFENTNLTKSIEGERQPDVILYGDVHNAYIQNITGKSLCNVGSVGNPLEITQASYVILEGKYGQEVTSSFSIQFVRVPYDIDFALKLAREADMPEYEEYVQELTTAKYRGQK